MERIYILGCNGFVGSNLFEYFKSLNTYEVIGVDLGENREEKENIYSDFKDVEFLSSRIKEGSCVVNTAAYVPNNEEDREEIYLVNRKITNFIINVFREKQIKSFYNISGINIYGYGVSDLKFSKEQDKIVLNDYYAKAKYDSEVLFTNTFHNCYNLRVSSPFGKNKKNKALLEKMILHIKDNEEVKIYGQGARKQDFIYVKDIGRIIQLMLKTNIDAGEYNLSNGGSKSVMDIIKTLEKIYNKEVTIESLDLSEGYSVEISNDLLLKKLNIDKNYFTDFKTALEEVIK